MRYCVRNTSRPYIALGTLVDLIWMHVKPLWGTLVDLIWMHVKLLWCIYSLYSICHIVTSYWKTPPHVSSEKTLIQLVHTSFLEASKVSYPSVLFKTTFVVLVSLFCLFKDETTQKNGGVINETSVYLSLIIEGFFCGRVSYRDLKSTWYISCFLIICNFAIIH